jgi:hypothetical protein
VDSDRLTWDHVFPKSWYPDTTPPNLEKWKVPACLKCNREYGVLEEDLFTAFGLCLDPDAEDTKALVEKALRAIDPSAGRDSKDKKKRAQRRLRILSQLMDADQIPEHATLPHFGRTDIPDGETGGIRIRARYLEKFCGKIVRGISYLEDGLLIRPPYRVHFYSLHDEHAQPLVAACQRYGKVYAREPGIEILRAVTPEDGVSSVYAITIWKRLKMYAAVDAHD